MPWLSLFPAFRQILDAVSDAGVYEILMYLFFLLTIGWCVFWAIKIGSNGGGTYRLQPVPWIVTGIAVAAVVAYFTLFADLSQPAAAGATGLWYMTSSPLVFALCYCLIIPLFIGAPLGLAVKAFLALFETTNPD